MAVVRNCEASNLIIMGCQEVLIMGILQISDHDAASGNKDELFQTWVQMHRVNNFARVTNRVVQFHLLGCSGLNLSEIP